MSMKEEFEELNEESWRQKINLILARIGLLSLYQNPCLGPDLTKDLVEVFKKHGIVND